MCAKQDKIEARGSRGMASQKSVKNSRRSNRERKMALIQDVFESSLNDILFLLLFHPSSDSRNHLLLV